MVTASPKPPAAPARPQPRRTKPQHLPFVVPDFDKPAADAALAAFLASPSLENRRDLIAANLRQAFTILIRMQGEANQHNLREELGAATIGMFDAARTFDPTRGLKFSTYAYVCTRNRIRESRIDEWRQTRGMTPLSEAESEYGEFSLDCSGRELPPDEVARCREAIGRRITRCEILRAVRGAIPCGKEEKYRRHFVAFYLYCIRGFRLLDIGKLLSVTVERVRQLIEVVKVALATHLRKCELFGSWRSRFSDWMDARNLKFA